MTPLHQRTLEERSPHNTRTYFVTSLDRCERLWKTLISPKYISDLWEFRLGFYKNFHCKPCFLVIEDKRGIAGMMPLSFMEDLDMYFLFPGELWENKTWLERTPFYARNERFFYHLLRACPENCFLRYLEIEESLIVSELPLDEIGYVLYPGDMDHDISQYYNRFSRKKIKAIKKVIQSYYDAGCEIYNNRLQDFDRLVEMSLQQFGRKSFMYDLRFQKGFRETMNFLNDKNILRMISCEIGGNLAAVDIGSVYNGVYTVFLGGTNPEFPGIAKLMNMNHIDFGFKERLHKIDFLCGDFHWKKLWHLDPEPLCRFEPSASIWKEATATQNIQSSMISLY